MEDLARLRSLGSPMPSIMHAQLSSGDIHINLGLGLHLRPYFAYAGREDSGENARMHSLARTFAARCSD